MPLPPRGAPRNCFQCRSQPGFNSLLPLDECSAHRWGVTPCDRQRPSFCHSKIKADNTDKPECHAINFKSLSSSEGKATSSRCAAPSQVRGMPCCCSCNTKSHVEKNSHLGMDMKCCVSHLSWGTTLLQGCSHSMKRGGQSTGLPSDSQPGLGPGMSLQSMSLRIHF